MKITCVSIGKKHDDMFSEAIAEYTKRISKHIKIEWVVLSSDENSEKEGIKILKNISPDDFCVVLDEKGKEFSTKELALFLETRMSSGVKQVVFVIGGAYGVSEGVLKRGQIIWSLSKLTFPHQLVRLILSETLYRSISVLKNEPYHHQ